MPKAIADPEELRRFAFDLKRFNTDLQSQLSAIQRRFLKLGETWQDEEHAKFAEVFEAMMRSLAKFVEASDRHIPFLLRKAQRIQEYLDQG
ncbi:MAG: WXG100 family type VII secretion target [Planctomycetota bacterium]|nr:WXG100 family type VII secretion target [Planctomycetota bacterium]